MLIAKMWKLQDTLKLSDWVGKMRFVCLMSKVTALYKYRAGVEQALRDFMCQWAPFINSQYAGVLSDYLGDII